MYIKLIEIDDNVITHENTWECNHYCTERVDSCDANKIKFEFFDNSGVCKDSSEWYENITLQMYVMNEHGETVDSKKWKLEK